MNPAKPPMEVGQVWSRGDGSRWEVVRKRDVGHGWFWMQKVGDTKEVMWDENRVHRQGDPRVICSPAHPLLKGECL